MKNIVIDCNVFISAFIGSEICYKVIDKAFSHYQVCYSDATLQELLEVLKRPKFQNFLKTNRVETTLEFLHSFGTRYKPKPCYLKLPDPDDIIYLDLALATKAKYIITGNKKHFPGKTCADIKVLSPGEFLKINL